MDNKHVRFIGPVLSVRAPDKKASNAETAEIEENDSRVLDEETGLFCFSRRALRPLRFILFQALPPPSALRSLPARLPWRGLPVRGPNAGRARL
jgi:hypothetical protein